MSTSPGSAGTPGTPGPPGNAGPPAATAPPPRTVGQRAARIAVVAIIVGSVLLWAFVLTREPGKPFGELDDSAFATAAEPVCAAAAARIAALPAAFDARTAAERADVVDQATDSLVAMLTELEPLAPPPGARDGDMVAEWLGDWRTYLDNRQDYTARLRVDEEARFYVAEKDARQITEPIDRFARVNRMASCATPRDLG